MPVGDVLVGDAGCHVEHDDTALAVDVVAITETAKLLLTGSVPHVELDRAVVLGGSNVSMSVYGRDTDRGGVVFWEETHGGEAKGVNLDTEGGHVLLLEFTSQVTLDKGGLYFITKPC